MSTRGYIFAVLFVGALGGALYAPLIGVLAYVLHYHVAPETTWWGRPLASAGVRFSFLLAIFMALGAVLHHRRLRYGPRAVTRIEWLMLVFLAIVWISHFLGLPLQTTDSTVVDPPHIKLTKVMVFCLIMTHVVTTRTALNALVWAMVVGVLYLGWSSYFAPRWMFVGGRLDGIGGPDFREANGLAGYLACALPIVGVQFLRTGWRGKLLCLAAGALAVNTIVLTQSRGAMVALAGGGIIAIVLSPRRHRRTILVSVAVVIIGGLALADEAFWGRASTISAPEEQRDIATRSRLEIWGASAKMFADHPLGVGVNRFQPAISRYVPHIGEADAHNTYILCYSELGVQGIVMYLVIIVVAMRTLWRIRKESQALQAKERDDLIWLSYAFTVSLSILILRGLTMSRLYTEASWWLLLLPVCLHRAMENAKADMALGATTKEASEAGQRKGQAKGEAPSGQDHRPRGARGALHGQR